MLVFSISGFLTFLQTSLFVIGYISKNSLFPEPLNAEEEKMYLQMLENGDKEARTILIERNLRLVAHVCKKYSNNKTDLDDLISIGTIGLIKGIDSFNYKKGVRLATYVSRCIDNEILMHFRSAKKLNAEVYLEDTVGKDKDDNTVSLQEVLENNERSVDEEVDLKFKIKKLYAKMKTVLKDREFGIITMRFGLDGKRPRTQEQIAKMLGISRWYVSRIETKAIGKLAKEFKEWINWKRKNAKGKFESTQIFSFFSICVNGCQWGRFFLTTIERVDFVEFVGATNNELLALKNKELDVKTLYSKIGSAVTDYNRESVI